MTTAVQSKPDALNGAVRIVRRDCSIELHNCDCLPFMRALPDKAFNLAICDPPYGIGAEKGQQLRAGTQRGNAAALSTFYGTQRWDSATPDETYFNELFRVSKAQIIWGGNHFRFEPSEHWIVWDKLTGDNKYADCELAWTSFDGAIRKFTFQWSGMLQGNMAEKEIRIHPTQKPVALYSWLLANYAKPGQTIFDSHLGSGSIAIACLNHGYSLTACELDPDYFSAATERIQREANQGVFL